MPVCFSTCWNGSRHRHGEDLVREILDLGFDTIEVSHGMKVSLLPGIRKMVEQGEVKVCGLHNFCPSPVEVSIDAPDCYEFTDMRSYVRERAQKLTLQTIDFAAELGGKYVVLHMGSVSMPKLTERLEEMARRGHLNSRAYVEQKHAFIKKRERLGPHYFRRAIDALARLADHAAERGVTLAIESRSHYEQVPSEREMVTLLDHFEDHPGVGYWHDFGHVQRKHNLALLDHTQWLGRMLPHLVGCHVHDVEWPERDHRVPFHGDMELARLLGMVSHELPLVWELSLSRRRVHIRRAKEIWDEIFSSPPFSEKLMTADPGQTTTMT